MVYIIFQHTHFSQGFGDWVFSPSKLGLRSTVQCGLIRGAQALHRPFSPREETLLISRGRKKENRWERRRIRTSALGFFGFQTTESSCENPYTMLAQATKITRKIILWTWSAATFCKEKDGNQQPWFLLIPWCKAKTLDFFPPPFENDCWKSTTSAEMPATSRFSSKWASLIWLI